MRNKIGIVLPFQNGDLITGASVLKYKDDLWPNCDIVWFCNEPHKDALKFQNIEIRYFPHGWGILEKDIKGVYTERVKKDKLEGRPDWEDWSVLVNSENRLKQELKDIFHSMRDLREVYFPAPWMLNPIQRHGIEYANCSKKVFGVPEDWQWHPYLMWSDEERQMAKNFIDRIGEGKRVFIETFAGSSQSVLDEEMIVHAMNICSEVWPECKFIFASHKFLRKQEEFPAYLFEQKNIYSCRDFTVRQCALVAEQCDLMLSVSSGITVAASAWGIKSPAILQFCGSRVCSTKALANGDFELVTADDKKLHDAKNQYFIKLMNLLNRHK